MGAADSEGLLYNQIDLETEIQKKIRKEIDRCASYWKQIEVSVFFCGAIAQWVERPSKVSLGRGFETHSVIGVWKKS